MKRILVTGGAGFIGSKFVRALLQHENAVRIWTLDALTYAGDLKNLANLPDPARHSFFEGDICNEGLVVQLLRDLSIDTIMHFAAETHVSSKDGMVINLPNRLYEGEGRHEEVDEIRHESNGNRPFEMG